MKLYSVVNMDIVGSRKVKDRQGLQINLDSYIEQINNKYGDILAAPITVTLGDEWQIITDKPSESYNLVHEFQKLFWKDEIELYAGIGIGELATPVSGDVRKMDGPCFHTARDALNIIKNMDKLKSKYSTSKLNKVFLLAHPILNDELGPDILDYYYASKSGFLETAMQETAAAHEVVPVCINSLAAIDRTLLERTINLLIENNEILKAKMTRKQKEVYIKYSRLGSYRKVVEASEGTAKESIGGISQKLNSASYFTIQRNQQLISLLLDTYCSGGV